MRKIVISACLCLFIFKSYGQQDLIRSHESVDSTLDFTLFSDKPVYEEGRVYLQINQPR